jgi:hypothetical protein
MAKPKLSSLLVVGVDLGPGAETAAWSEHKAVATQLLAMLEANQISATWTVANTRLPWLQELRAARTWQEIALHWDAPLVKEPSEAFAFAAELRTRLRAAEAADLRIQSLSIDPRSLVPYHALAKAGVRMIRPARVRGSQLVRSVQPQAMRYGIWGLPVSCFWPQPHRMLEQLSLQHLLYQMRLASQQANVLHVVLDLPTIARQPDRHLRTVEKLTEQAARLQNMEQLRTARLADVARLVQAETAARPNRSILQRIA